MASSRLNAIDQTLQQILTRIAKQVDMRWEIDGPNLLVMPDSPFLRNYKVDYVNMSRDVKRHQYSINTSDRIAQARECSWHRRIRWQCVSKQLQHLRQEQGKERFWETLEKNLKDILRETDKILPEGSSETVIERSDQQATTGTGAVGSAVGKVAAAVTNLAGSPNAASLQQQGTTVVKRDHFREAASIIVNPEQASSSCAPRPDSTKKFRNISTWCFPAPDAR
jgi:hypothetical protein